MARIISIIIFLFISINLYSQTNRIRGAVLKNDGTNEPIKDVKIIDLVSGESDISDSEGRFKINLPNENRGGILLRAKYIGKNAEEEYLNSDVFRFSYPIDSAITIYLETTRFFSVNGQIKMYGIPISGIRIFCNELYDRGSIKSDNNGVFNYQITDDVWKRYKNLNFTFIENELFSDTVIKITTLYKSFLDVTLPLKYKDTKSLIDFIAKTRQDIFDSIYTETKKIDSLIPTENVFYKYNLFTIACKYIMNMDIESKESIEVSTYINRVQGYTSSFIENRNVKTVKMLDSLVSIYNSTAGVQVKKQIEQNINTSTKNYKMVISIYESFSTPNRDKKIEELKGFIRKEEEYLKVIMNSKNKK